MQTHQQFTCHIRSNPLPEELRRHKNQADDTGFIVKTAKLSFEFSKY
jgi:hypothetical protein